MGKKIRMGKKYKKKRKGKKTLLTCTYCGEDLNVKVIDITPQPSRGKLKHTEKKTTILTVSCSSCHQKSIFERQSPHFGRFGWVRVRADFEPSAFRPRISESSETSAMLRRRRRQ